MSILRKIGHFGVGVLRRVGQVGGNVLKGVSAVKGVMDSSGLTHALQGALMSNPMTAPAGAAMSLSNPVLKAGQGLTTAMSKVGR